MNLSEFQKEQIQKYLDSSILEESNLSSSEESELSFFDKSQLVKFLDRDNTPKEKKQVIKRPTEIQKEVIVKREIIEKDIDDNKIKEIITTIESKIRNGRDGKDAPSTDELVDALKRDFEFMQKVRPQSHPLHGGGGLGEGTVREIIENLFIANSDRIITAELDINNIIDNNKYIGNRLQLVVVDNNGNVVTEGGY